MFSRHSLRSGHFCILFMLLVLAAGCLPGGDPGAGIRGAAGPYALDLAAWELQNSLAPLSQATLAPGLPVSPAALSEDVGQELARQGIAVVPPVMTRLQDPPLLLVVSPRDRILYLDRLLLLPGLDAAQVEEVESGVGSMGLSALVVKIGGFGAAYPAIVSPSMPLKNIVGAAVEEWAHQYLAFRPLGFLYLLDSLGFSQDPNVITMNETLAGMISDEIGAAVYSRYGQGQGVQQGSGPAEGFDFDAEMRTTRGRVDELLASGKVGEAEDYMEARRVFFNAHGYPIRKLNQAYFAFHGIYGQDPGSASPIYGQMLKLRAASVSLAAFVDRVSSMMGYDQLEDTVKELPR